MQIGSKLYDKAGGSLGMITAAGSKGINYLKMKPKQRQRNTQRQQFIKNTIAEANHIWSRATEAQRAAWGEYGKTLTKTNSTGHLVIYTGLNAFSRAYVLFEQIRESSEDLIYEVPRNKGYIQSPELRLTGATNLESIRIINTSSQNFRIVIYIGKPTKETINHYKSGYKYHTATYIGGGSDATIQRARFIGKNWYRFISYETDGAISKEVILTNIRDQ